MRGRVTTELRADEVESAHSSIVFRDSTGREIIEYGAATVLDAAGRSAPIETSYDGGHVELRVPAAWLAGATYPVVIDPLTSNKLAVLFGGSTHSVRLERESVSTSRNVLLSFIRSPMGGDYDGYAYLLNEDFTQPVLIYSNITARYVDDLDSAYVRGANRWLIGFRESDLTTQLDHVRAYLHDRANTRRNSGTTVEIPSQLPGNLTRRHMAVGGSDGSHRAVVAVIEDGSLSPLTQRHVYAFVVDALAQRVERFALVRSFTVPFASRDDLPQSIDVSGSDNEADGWVLCWQGYGRSPEGKFSAWVARFLPNGSFSPSFLVEAGEDGTTSDRPKIAGQGGKYVVAYRVQFRETRLVRVDWVTGAPTFGLIRKVVHADRGIRWGGDFDLAFDLGTRTHWALAIREFLASGGVYRIIVHRLGHALGVVESQAQTYSSDISAPAVAYDTRHDAFLMIWQANSGGIQGFFGASLNHAQDLGTTPYGVSCGGAISATVPYAGHDDWAVRLVGAAQRAPAVLAVGGRRADLPLLPGCNLLVDPLGMVVVPTTTTFGGSATMSIKLPNYPGAFIGDVYLQWAYISVKQLKLSNGLHARIRP